MKNTKHFGFIAIVAIIALFAVSCDSGGGGGGGPVDVDMKLPNIASVASFSGTFVGDAAGEETAKVLIEDAMDEIGDIFEDIFDQFGFGDIDVPGFRMIGNNISIPARNNRTVSLDNSRVAARALYDSDEGFFDLSEGDINIAGVKSIEGYISYKWIESDFEDSGDVDLITFTYKMAIELEGYTRYGLTINGKVTNEGSFSMKEQVTKTNPFTTKISASEKFSGSGALSIYRGGNGLKMVITESGSWNVSMTMNWDTYQPVGNPSYKESYKLSFTTYDNPEGTGKGITRKFTNYWDAEDYFGW